MIMNDKPIVFDSRRELKIAPTASGLTLLRNRMVLSHKLSESRRSVGMTTPWRHISQSINHPQTTSLQSFLKGASGAYGNHRTNTPPLTTSFLSSLLRKSSYRAFKRRSLKARLIARHQNC